MAKVGQGTKHPLYSFSKKFCLLYLRRKRSKRQNCHHFLLSLIFHFFFSLSKKEETIKGIQFWSADVYMREVRKLFPTLGRRGHWEEMCTSTCSWETWWKEGIFSSFYKTRIRGHQQRWQNESKKFYRLYPIIKKKEDYCSPSFLIRHWRLSPGRTLIQEISLTTPEKRWKKERKWQAPRIVA